MAAKRPDTIPESTPRLNIRGSRYAPLNVSVERTKQRRMQYLFGTNLYPSSKLPNLVPRAFTVAILGASR